MSKEGFVQAPNPMLRNILAKIEGTRGVRTLTRWLTRRVPRIFMFHRFSAIPSADATDADELHRFIDRVGAECEFVTVRELVSRLDPRKRPEKPLAAITVDDGYADFHEVALPVLAERRIPATLYATAGFLDGRCWLWWDALRYLLDAHPEGTLELELAGQRIAHHLGNPQSRQAAWSGIADELLTRNDERPRILAQLEAAAGSSLPARPTLRYAAMNWAQLAEAEAAGIEIGGHTMTHAFLPALDPEGLRHELDEAKTLMERHLTHPLTTFAYPNGTPIDCTPSVVAAIRAAGFSAAVLAHPRPFRADDRFRLGRWSVRSSEPRLERILSGASILRLTWGGA